jgi:hypothetical protein
MILADPGAAPRYCLILDRSNSGVRLRTTSDFQAPGEFFLRCMDTESKYKVVWRRGSSLGAIANIAVPVKRRATLKPQTVQEIAQSILEFGQQAPILVRRDGDRLVLIHGLHRLEACKALGEETIYGYLVQAVRH